MKKEIEEIIRKWLITISLIIWTINGIIIKEYEKWIDKLNIQIQAYIDILNSIK